MKYSAENIFWLSPVIPVITIHEIETAIPIARALAAGGLKVLEITLRTQFGLEAIRRIKQEVPDVIVGAGTVVNQADLDNAISFGSDFIVTPGLTPNLLKSGVKCGVPFIPGIASISELMCCIDVGLNALKFFPAEVNGGAKALRAFGGPFPTVSFCPTGGITMQNLTSYLEVPSVKTVGGTWLTPDTLVSNHDWKTITALATAACELVSSFQISRTKAE